MTIAREITFHGRENKKKKKKITFTTRTTGSLTIDHARIMIEDRTAKLLHRLLSIPTKRDKTQMGETPRKQSNRRVSREISAFRGQAISGVSISNQLFCITFLLTKTAIFFLAIWNAVVVIASTSLQWLFLQASITQSELYDKTFLRNKIGFGWFEGSHSQHIDKSKNTTLRRYKVRQFTTGWWENFKFSSQ